MRKNVGSSRLFMSDKCQGEDDAHARSERSAIAHTGVDEAGPRCAEPASI
jgi:hypothetical protein